MNWSRVIYTFFALMCLTTVAGFLYDHNDITLFIAASINLISTLLKIGVRNMLSAELFASSLVADLHLIPALVIMMNSGFSSIVFGLALGGLVANAFSMVLILREAGKSRDDFQFLLYLARLLRLNFASASLRRTLSASHFAVAQFSHTKRTIQAKTIILNFVFNFVLLGTALTSSTLPSQYSLKTAFKKFEYLFKSLNI